MQFDPEAYLEQRLGEAPVPPPPPPAAEENGSRGDKRKHSRSPKRGSRSPRRHRDRSRSPRRREGDREFRERGRDSRDRDHRDYHSRDRDRDFHSRDRDGPRYRDERRERPRSPEDPAEQAEKKRRQEEENFERDLRTVFVTQIHMKADDMDVLEFFSKAGEVSDVRLIKDQKTRKSKGTVMRQARHLTFLELVSVSVSVAIGYVEMTRYEDVIKALSLSGQLIMGFPINVQASQAEKNRAARLAAAAVIPSSRLFIQSLFVNVCEDDLKMVFKPFGEIDSAHVDRDGRTKISKGTGWIQFQRVEDAQAAFAQMNGELLAGVPMHLSLPAADGGLAAQQQALPHLTNIPVGMPTGPAIAELDDDAGVTLNAASRAKLMMQLGRGELSQPDFSAMHNKMPEAPQQPRGPPPATIPPTAFVVLKNMFSPACPTDEYSEILEDVRGECSRFGPVAQIFGDRRQGSFYLRFGDRNAAFDAQKAMNGRWFAGNMIIADYVTEADFHYIRSQNA